MNRNLSMEAYFRATAAKHRPTHRFSGASEADFLKWRGELLPAVRSSLARMPEKVPLNPQIQAEWIDDGLIRQRVIFDVEEEMAAVAYVFRPEGASGPLPGILACHGHGPDAKDNVMGNRSSRDRAANIAQHNYDYGLQMAKDGFAVIAIDWRGFGERAANRMPNHSSVVGNRDHCNIDYVRATMLGMTMLGMDVHDGMRALDYLCEQDFVDPERIGVMGLSFGGTMTTWMAVCDERIKAADIVCYSSMFAAFGMRDGEICGSQVTPGLYALCDVPDLHGLIAPRPLLVEIGSYDNCFLIDSALECFHEVEKIYAAAGARDVLELDLFDGGHMYSGRKAPDFFKKHLGG